MPGELGAPGPEVSLPIVLFVVFHCLDMPHLSCFRAAQERLVIKVAPVRGERGVMRVDPADPVSQVTRVLR